MCLCGHVLSVQFRVAGFLVSMFEMYFWNCLVCLGGFTWCACGCEWEYLLSRAQWVKGAYLVPGKPQSYIYDLTKDSNAINKCSAGSLPSPWHWSLACCGSGGTHSKNIAVNLSSPVCLFTNLNHKSDWRDSSYIQSCKLMQTAALTEVCCWRHVKLKPFIQDGDSLYAAQVFSLVAQAEGDFRRAHSSLKPQKTDTYSNQHDEPLCLCQSQPFTQTEQRVMGFIFPHFIPSFHIYGIIRAQLHLICEFRTEV